METIGITFAVIAGTAAGLLALLTWDVFRQSRFGRGIFFLIFVMSLFIIYHATLIPFAPEAIVVNAIESVVYTGFVIVMWLLAWTHPARKAAG